MHRSENTYACWRCGRTGHDPKSCWARTKPVANVNQLARKKFGSAKTKVKQIIEGLDSSDSGNEAYAMAVHSGIHRTGTAFDSFRMKLNGISMEVIIDSGASVNVMDSTCCTSLHRRLIFPSITHISQSCLPTTVRLSFQCWAKLQLPWRLLVNRWNLTGSWCKGQGRRDAEQLKLLLVGPLVNAICLETKSTALPASTQKVLDAHSSVFSGIGCLKDVKVHITLEDDAVPVACRYTRVPVHL